MPYVPPILPLDKNRAHVYIRSAGATALHLLLLFPLLLDVAWNELLCCDHGPEHHEVVADAPDVGIHILPAEEEHEDDCLCCGICSQRVSLDPASTTDSTLWIAEIQAAKQGAFFVKPRPASHLSRGPPSSLSRPIS